MSIDSIVQQYNGAVDALRTLEAAATTRDPALLRQLVDQNAAQYAALNVLTMQRAIAVPLRGLQAPSAVNAFIAKTVWDVVGRRVVDVALQSLVTYAVENVVPKVMDVVGPALDISVAAIPVVNWIVDAVIGVVKAGFAIAEMSKKPEPARLPVAVPSVAADSLMAEEVYRVLATSDLTRLFKPSKLSWGKSYKDGWECPRLEGGGWRIAARGTSTDGIGYLLGTGKLFRSVEMMPTALRDIGSDHNPLTVSACSVADGMLHGTANPTVFYVDYDHVEGLWDELFRTLHEFLDSPDCNDASEHAAAWRTLIGGRWSIIQGGWPAYKRTIRHLRRLRERRSLTPLVFQVDETGMAPACREYWRTAITRALQSEMVMTVDPATIPDQILSEQVVREQAARRAMPARKLPGARKQTPVTGTPVPARQSVVGADTGGSSVLPVVGALGLIVAGALVLR